jgi:hypothetical protein
MKTNSNILSHSSIFFSLILFFLLIYWPVTQGHYLWGEDYLRIWTGPFDGVSKQSYTSYTRTLWVEGRPLLTLYFYLIFNKYINVVKSFEAVNTIRIIGMIGIGLLAWVLFLIFKANRLRTNHAFFLSILICTLPPIQVFIGRLILIAFIYSALLAALAFFILFKTVSKQNEIKRTHVMLAISTSIAMFIASLCIYQPTATIYWALGIIPVIMMEDKDFVKNWRKFLVIFSAGFASMVIYYGVIKIYNSILNIQLMDRGSLVYRPADVYHKLIWFIKYPLYFASNLWNIVHTKDVALLVCIVIIMGILFSLGRTVKKIIAEKKELNLLLIPLFRFLVVLVLIPLSYVPSLVTKGLGETFPFMPHHRTLLGPDISVLLLLYWGIMNIVKYDRSSFHGSVELQKKIVTICLLILTVYTAFLANYNVDKYYSNVQTNDYKYVKDTIVEYGESKLQKVSKIYTIKRDKEETIKFSLIYGEFYNITLPGLIIRLVLYELGIHSDITIEPLENYISLPVDNDILIIDMRKVSLLDKYG